MMTAQDIVDKIRSNTQRFVDYNFNGEKSMESQPDEAVQLETIQNLIDRDIHVEVCNGPVFLTESHKGSEALSYKTDDLEIQEDTKTVVFYMWYHNNHNNEYGFRYLEFDTMETVIPLYKQ